VNRFDTIVPISELQTRSKQLVEQVKKTGQPIVVTQRGRPAAMLVNFDLYEGHLATIDEMSFPDWEERLERAKKEIREGRYVGHDEISQRAARRRRKP
jgi:prevent-host-death family protein